MKKLPVTDYAVLSYLEQVAAIDINQVRQHIFNDTKQALAEGASGLVANGISYRFRNGKVVSVWIDHQHKKPLEWGSAK